MDKTSASGRYQKPSSGRRVRLIPSTPRPELLTPTTSSSSTADTTQSPETSPSDSHSGSPRGVMRRVRPMRELSYPFTYQATNVSNEEITPSAPNSLESLDETASLPDTQAMIFTSSSSHDLLADTGSNEGETGSDRAEGERIHGGRSVGMEQVATGGEQLENLVEIVVIDSEEDQRGVERTSFTLEEIASEAIREMQEFKRKRKGKSIWNPEGPALETQDKAEA